MVSISYSSTGQDFTALEAALEEGVWEVHGTFLEHHMMLRLHRKCLSEVEGDNLYFEAQNLTKHGCHTMPKKRRGQR